ncbi:MAG: GxxExxY protein [Bacteroidia bacterium]
MKKEAYDELTGLIISAAIEVHRELGPGILESVYEHCLLYELRKLGLRAENQVILPLVYKGHTLNKNFIVDILVEDLIIVELKSVNEILPIHEIQLVTYLKLASKKLGLLLNFNAPMMKDGIKRKINGYF